MKSREQRTNLNLILILLCIYFVSGIRDTKLEKKWSLQVAYKSLSNLEKFIFLEERAK